MAGCDVFVGRFEWSLTRQYKEGVTLKYLNRLSELAGTVSAGAFMGWAAEEVLFLGAEGSGGENKAASLTYTFSAKSSRSNVPLGATGRPIVQTAVRISGTPGITIGTTAGVTVGMQVVGEGIPDGATVASIVDGWTLTMSANATSTGTDPVTITDGPLVVPFVGGWDHVWVAYGPSQSTNVLTQVPKFAYVEQVYDVESFDALGLGG